MLDHDIVYIIPDIFAKINRELFMVSSSASPRQDNKPLLIYWKF